MLGFRVLMKVPQKGTPELGAALAMPSYLVEGALMVHRDGSLIDLLEWKQPRHEDPPYPVLNHLGLARLAHHTRNIEADVAYLKEKGVSFLSEIVRGLGVMGRSKFVCFQDPDGTVIELVDTGRTIGFFRSLFKRLGISPKGQY